MNINKAFMRYLLFVWLTGMALMSYVDVYSQQVTTFQKTLDGAAGQLVEGGGNILSVTEVFSTASLAKLQPGYPVKNAVCLLINQASNIYLKDSFTLTVNLRVVSKDANGQVDSSDRQLKVNYTKSGSYQSVSSYVMNGRHEVQLKILSVVSSVSWDVLNVIQLENRMEVQPDFNFFCDQDVITGLSYNPIISSGADELPVSWMDVTGIDVYDLEWCFIDSSALDRKKSNGVLDVARIFANNASRVTIAGTAYKIPLLYNNGGVVFFRVRPVQLKARGARLEGKWSSDFATGLGMAGFYGHERGLNWQANTSFAEEGKRKTIVQYFDGSLRSRQMVTKDNTRDTTIIAESLYDHQGRAVIQIMPAPSLSNVIQFTRDFNMGINGTEYDKEKYDVVLNPATYCGATAQPMSASSGSSNYYSPFNPDKNNGLNRFIPDAGLYPFSQTEYAPDNTGKITREGGVGPNYQLNSGHETRYYYGGAPSQKELYGLFGTEVGDATHYTKNMVRDANGQYTVNYVDMHGRTVATALAGKLADSLGMQSLASNKEKRITEEIGGIRSNVTKGLVMESQKVLLVSLDDDYDFHYSLNPQQVQIENCEGTGICYDCLYDLEITITDDCNNQKIGRVFDTIFHNFSFGGSDTLNTNCGITPRNFDVDFKLRLPEGSYIVTKRLSVSRQAVDFYRDSIYMANNTCRTLNTFISEQRSLQLVTTGNCETDCAGCRAQVGEWSDFRVSYLQRIGVLLPTGPTQDTAIYTGEARAAWEAAMTNCDALCKIPADLDQIRRSMLLDMTAPSGQYANAADVEDKYSVFYNKDAQGNLVAPLYKTDTLVYRDQEGAVVTVYDDNSGTSVLPGALTQDQFAAKFIPSWANTLLPFHPEYCKLVEYEKHRTSMEWDQVFGAVETYQEALEKGFLNPVGYTTAPFNKFPVVSSGLDPLSQENNQQLLGRLRDSLLHYRKEPGSNNDISLWSLATMVTACGSEITDACKNTYRSADTAFNSAMCAGDKDMAWRTFRQLYLEIKNNVVQDLIDKANCSGKPSVKDLRDAGHTLNFNTSQGAIEQNGIGDLVNTNNASQSEADTKATMGQYYNDNCRSYATLWLKQLAPCTEYAPATRDSIIEDLVLVCRKGADSNHPNGSKNISPDSANIYNSFDQVIQTYNAIHQIQPNIRCNADVITNLQPYNSQNAYAQQTWTGPQPCECEKIQGWQQQYLANKKPGETFSAYMVRKAGTVISDSTLNTLLSLCGTNAACHYLTKPVSIPPVFQCYTGDVCVSCKTVDSLFRVYKSVYPSYMPSASNEEGDSLQDASNRFFENFMSNRLGFSKSAWEFLEFRKNCITEVPRPAVCAEDSLPSALGITALPSDVPCDKVIRIYKNYLVDFPDHINGATFKIRRGELADGELVDTTMNARQLFEWYMTNYLNLPHGQYAYTDYIGWVANNNCGFKLHQLPWSDSVYVSADTLQALWSRFVQLNPAGPSTTVTKTVSLPFYKLQMSYVQLVDYDETTNYTALIDGPEEPYPYLLTEEWANGGMNYLRHSTISVNYRYLPPHAQISNARLSLKPAYFPWSNSGAHFRALWDEPFGILSGTEGMYLPSKTKWETQPPVDSLPKLTIATLTEREPDEWEGNIYSNQQYNNQDVTDMVRAHYTRFDTGGANYALSLDLNSYSFFSDYPKRYVFGGAGAQLPDSSAPQLLITYTASRCDEFVGFVQQQLNIQATYNQLMTLFSCKGNVTVDCNTTSGGGWARMAASATVPPTSGTLVDTVLSTELILCGKSAPLLPEVVVEQFNNCSDSSFYILNKATELFQYQQDSLKGNFEADYLAKCMLAYRYESFTVEHAVREYHYTLYYYDQAGNLAKTLSPKEVNPDFSDAFINSVTQAALNDTLQLQPVHGSGVTYLYNTFNQTVAQASPDAGTSKFWYDRLGRLALSQNAEQYLGGKYSYTQYDELGRVTEAGQTGSEITMHDTLSRQPILLHQWMMASMAAREQITHTIYDLPYMAINSALIARNLRNRVSYSALYENQAKLVGSEPAMATYYSYDMHGNVDTLLHDYRDGVMYNNGNGFKKIVYGYDLISGKVNYVGYQPGEIDAFYHRYVYDADNRITAVETSRDSIHWEEDAWYSYYKHGPLARLELGAKVQGIDYVYTLQGWVKAVNPNLLQTGGSGGSGESCTGASAVNDLVVNARVADGPSIYTARRTVSMEDGFDSNGDALEARIDSSLGVCDNTIVDVNSDGKGVTGTAADAFSYVLHYNRSDYKGINAPAPDALVPVQLGNEYRPLFNGSISNMAVNIGKLNQPVVYNYQYDQLNRLVKMDVWNKATASWTGLRKTTDYAENITYDPNGNILSYLRNGVNADGRPLTMDNLQYQYTGLNRLGHVVDSIPDSDYEDDLDSQLSGNYSYDAIGNLIGSKKDGIASVKWTVYGKIAEIVKSDSTHIKYTYDVTGNRISKAINGETTWYVRDAYGNVMSVYKHGDEAINQGSLSQTEIPLYGSARLGVVHRNIDVVHEAASGVGYSSLDKGSKVFELSNHLGNVMVAVSDRKLPVSANNSTIDYYTAEVISAQDYYPFGMLQPGRSYNSEGYRYGFNGQERSSEIYNNSFTAEFWEYDARVGRRWNVDPKPNVSISSYSCFLNNPIVFNDVKGDTVRGAAKSDAKTARDDIKGSLVGDKFANVRKLIEIDKNDKTSTTLASISDDALNEALKGVKLNDDEKAYLNGVVKTINSKEVHYIEFFSDADMLSDNAVKALGIDPKNAVSRQIAAALTQQTVADIPEGKLPAGWLKQLGGAATGKFGDCGSYSVVLKDPQTTGGGYFNVKDDQAAPVPKMRPTMHEIFGHGRLIALGVDNQHKAVIQFENLQLRVMGKGIYRDGTNHNTKDGETQVLSKEEQKEIPAYLK